jgi:hypothetical protein
MRTTLFFACLAVSACADPGDDDDCTDGKCDQTCADPQYGDGVCQTELSCAVPDIDCFRTFDDDEAAAAWFAELEPRVAESEGRPARKVLSPDDPRFAPMRALLDRGWDVMKQARPVGDLAKHRPGLVLIEDAEVNAFVMPEDLDQQRASFAVVVHTQTLDTLTSDDATLGLVMHELQHAVGLHVVAGVKERIWTYYLAGPDREPLGKDQQDNPAAREAAEGWRALAAEIGPLSQAPLRGMPTRGLLFRVLRAVFQAGATNPDACAHTKQLFTEVNAAVDAATDPVSGAPSLPDAFGDRVDAAFTALRDECLVGFDTTFVQIVAELGGTTPDVIEASLSPEDKALIADKHVVDAIAALTAARRTKMRAIEDAAPAQLSVPWSAMRFYTEEEAADDVTVPVLRGAGLDPEGLGTFFLETLMSPAAADACRPVLASGAVPAYGNDLLDTHHGNCWRTFHVGAVAASNGRSTVRRLGAPHPLRTTLPIPPVPDYATY